MYLGKLVRKLFIINVNTIWALSLAWKFFAPFSFLNNQTNLEEYDFIHGIKDRASPMKRWRRGSREIDSCQSGDGRPRAQVVTRNIGSDQASCAARGRHALPNQTLLRYVYVWNGMGNGRRQTSRSLGLQLVQLFTPQKCPTTSLLVDRADVFCRVLLNCTML